MESKIIKTPVATTKYCWLQGEGYKFKDTDKPVYKSVLIFEGADALAVKAEIDAAVVEFVEGEIETGDALTHKIYTFKDGVLELKTKVKVTGEKKDGSTFTRTLPVLDTTNAPVTDTVGSGSKVQMALKVFGWAGFGTVGLSAQPVAVLVHEANQGAGNAAGPRTKRSNDEWGDFFGEGAGASPATAGTPVEEDDI